MIDPRFEYIRHQILLDYKTEKPNIIPKGQMTNQRPPDIIEIGGIKYQKIEESNPPRTLYDCLSKSLDSRMIITADRGLKDTIISIVSNWIPKELEQKSIDSYASGWNDCLTRLRMTLR